MLGPPPPAKLPAGTYHAPGCGAGTKGHLGELPVPGLVKTDFRQVVRIQQLLAAPMPTTPCFPQPNQATPYTCTLRHLTLRPSPAASDTSSLSFLCFRIRALSSAGRAQWIPQPWHLSGSTSHKGTRLPSAASLPLHNLI